MIDLSNVLNELNNLAEDAEREGNALLGEAARIRGIMRGFAGNTVERKTKTYAQRRAIKAKAATILATPPWEAEEGKTVGSLPVPTRKKKAVVPKRKYTKKSAWWGKSKTKAKKAKKK